MFRRFKSAAKLHLSGVLGRDSAKTADFAARHATRAFGSVQEIAQDPTIDFVILGHAPQCPARYCAGACGGGQSRS